MNGETEKLRAGGSLREPVPDSGLGQGSSQAGMQCPDDFLTPREMVGFLRASEEGSVIPADVVEHMQTCTVCRPNWEFIEATDPALRQFREKRVDFIIRIVAQAENPVLERVPPAQRERLAGELEQELARPRSNALPKDGDLQIIVSKSEQLSVDQVLEFIARVQEIADDKRRYESANELAGLFSNRVELDKQRGKITIDFLDRLLNAEPATIHLSSKDTAVSLEAAVAFIASLPHASYFRPPLLEKTESGILFHRGRFASHIPEFDALRLKFGALCRSTTGAVR